MRVLIVKMSSMGDLVHALPMVTGIARAFPRAAIDWVVEESFADIPALHPAVQRVIPIALRRWRRQPWRRDYRQQMAHFLASLREHPYDLVLDCQGLLKSAAVAALAHGPVSGFDRRSAREPLASWFYQQRFFVSRSDHAIDRNLSLAALALGYESHRQPDFGLRDRVAALPLPESLTLQSPCVILFTHASRPGKYWPDDHWLALERTLAHQGLTSYLVAGGDSERTRSLALAARMQRAQVLPRLGLLALSAVIGAARGAVGLDTGLTHLAAAIGIPTVGIYCDYDPGLVGLRGSARVRSFGGVDQCPAVADVAATFLSFIELPPTS